jgi:hypothetical protein
VQSAIPVALMNTPFAVLTAVAAPAILTNACSVLALGTANRIARVVDRTRFINAEMETLPMSSPKYTRRLGELARLRQRSTMLVQALRVLYAALGFFAMAALVTVIGAALAYYHQPSFEVAAVLALVAGVLAVSGLVYGCTLLVRETRLALVQIGSEVDDVLRDRN